MAGSVAEFEKALIALSEAIHFAKKFSDESGTYREFSDLDVLFSNPPDVELPMGLLAKISESLEESDLPIKVDLVDEKYLASSYRPGVFKDRIPLLPPRLWRQIFVAVAS